MCPGSHSKLRQERCIKLATWPWEGMDRWPAGAFTQHLPKTHQDPLSFALEGPPLGQMLFTVLCFPPAPLPLVSGRVRDASSHPLQTCPLEWAHLFPIFQRCMGGEHLSETGVDPSIVLGTGRWDTSFPSSTHVMVPTSLERHGRLGPEARPRSPTSYLVRGRTSLCCLWRQGPPLSLPLIGLCPPPLWAEDGAGDI